MCVAAASAGTGGGGSFRVLFREAGLVARVSERRVRTGQVVSNCH